ncbi:MAG: DNA repair protein RadC [Chitinophagaceae bacterium]
MQEQIYSIKSWAKDDRPREKLLSKGPSTLSDSELIAILIHHGTHEKSAVDIAKEVLYLSSNNLSELGKLTIKDLTRIKGIGSAKAISIMAAMELGRRRQASMSLEKPVVKDSKSVAGYLQALLRDLRNEVLGVLYLNKSNRINHFEVVSEGGITSTIADPRLILKRALEEEAVKIILCHNHPSGNLTPSKADELLTSKIKGAGKLLDIELIDHIIVSTEGYFSFADAGML